MEPTTNSHEVTAEPDIYPMDEAFIALIAEYRQAALSISQQAHGALTYYLKQHNLAGSWVVAENGKELIRQPAAK